jgi:hypothetical protein
VTRPEDFLSLLARIAWLQRAVTGHPCYGLPWGQDRLVPIFLATLAVRQQSRTVTFTSAANMLETFGMQQGGSPYRRLVGAFQRIFGATIFFGTDTQSVRANVFHHAHFNFMSEAQIWCSRFRLTNRRLARWKI